MGADPNLWGFLGIHPSLREVLRELSWNGDVWLTEVGWRTDDHSLQQIADNYTGLFNDWLTGHPDRNWIDKILLYHAADDHYGIFNPDGSTRPAYDAIAGFIDAHRPDRTCDAPGCATLDAFETGGFSLTAGQLEGVSAPTVNETAVSSAYFGAGRRLTELRLEVGKEIRATLSPDAPHVDDDAITIVIERDSTGSATLSYDGDTLADLTAGGRTALEVTLGSAPTLGTLFAFAETAQTWDLGEIEVDGPGVYQFDFGDLSAFANDLDFTQIGIIGFGVRAEAGPTPLRYEISDFRVVAPGQGQAAALPEPGMLPCLIVGVVLSGLRRRG
ncbi:MAG: hypothetical protein CMJ18_09625 [Phycisphaeraceae bacterium]|nr:hypothetical protein [Phycisphaeraceae bacterium]